MSTDDIRIAEMSLDDKLVTTAADEPPFTAEEIQAFRETKSLLLTKHKMSLEKISMRELIIVTMNCKLRPETAADKYKRWLDLIDIGMGVSNFDMVWEEIGRGAEKLSGHELESRITRTFAGCGLDFQSRSVMWIRTNPVTIEEEPLAIKSSIIYFTAIHADMKSLRHGITFVLDTSKNPMDKLVGNENKLQKTWQSIPLRPQRIFILGCNMFKRLAINALLAIASLFTKEKVIERVLFATMDDVKKEIADSSLPIHIEGGGGAGGILTNEDLIVWIQNRLKNFPPIPEGI